MNKEITKVIFPNKKINFFTFSILLLGFVTGCIFLVILKNSDKNIVINQISNYFKSINDNNYNYGTSLKNNLIINNFYVIIIWLLGLSIIGIIFQIFILYIKSFILGFTVSGMMLTYKIKGIISSLLYLVFGELLSLIGVLIISTVSTYFTLYLIKLIFKKKNRVVSNKKEIKKYCIMLLICVILVSLSSVLESFLLPKILKLIISWFI